MVYAEENKNPIAIVVVQARTGSSRFPRKVLQDLAGKPLLAQMVARAKQAPGVVDVVIATSDLAQDDPIEIGRAHV